MKIVLVLYVLAAGGHRDMLFPELFDSVEQCLSAAGKAVAELRLRGVTERVATVCRPARKGELDL